MGWLARLALAVAVLAMSGQPGPWSAPDTSGAALAQSDDGGSDDGGSDGGSGSGDSGDGSSDSDDGGSSSDGGGDGSSGDGGSDSSGGGSDGDDGSDGGSQGSDGGSNDGGNEGSEGEPGGGSDGAGGSDDAGGAGSEGDEGSGGDAGDGSDGEGSDGSDDGAEGSDGVEGAAGGDDGSDDERGGGSDGDGAEGGAGSSGDAEDGASEVTDGVSSGGAEDDGAAEDDGGASLGLGDSDGEGGAPAAPSPDDAGEDPAPSAPVTADSPAAAPAPAGAPGSGATVGVRDAAPAPARTGRSLPEIIGRALGVARRPAPAPAPVEATAVEAPAEPAPDVARARAPEPPSAARAPRIELSSGDRAGSHRRHEITALGLTPRARQVVGALGFRVLSERRSALLGGRVVAKLRTPGDQTATAALRRVRGLLPEVVFDYAHLYRPTGGRVPVRYPVEMIGAPPGSVCRTETRVGLIDSGVGAHPSLAEARILRRSFVEQDAATNVAHGTAIASILVGDLPGSGPLLPGAELYAANVFTQDAGALRADAVAIIAALDWMAAQGVPVVNLSLMGPANALLEAAVRAAAGRGQILVAAAGNDGPDAEPAFPAAYPGVIAVAALDARGRPYGRNNRGGYIYVAAPGVDIWGADARGGEAFWTGTSFAAPFVAAALARDVAQGRARDVNDGRARIAARARDLGAPGRDPIFGHGLLQAGGCGGDAVLSSRD